MTSTMAPLRNVVMGSLFGLVGSGRADRWRHSASSALDAVRKLIGRVAVGVLNPDHPPDAVIDVDLESWDHLVRAAREPPRRQEGPKRRDAIRGAPWRTCRRPARRVEPNLTREASRFKHRARGGTSPPMEVRPRDRPSMYSRGCACAREGCVRGRPGRRGPRADDRPRGVPMAHDAAPNRASSVESRRAWGEERQGMRVQKRAFRADNPQGTDPSTTTYRCA